MKKLSLDDIQVVSHPTTGVHVSEPGTVNGQMATVTCPTWRFTCETTVQTCGCTGPITAC